jgi:hypothetical protein
MVVLSRLLMVVGAMPAAPNTWGVLLVREMIAVHACEARCLLLC